MVLLTDSPKAHRFIGGIEREYLKVKLKLSENKIKKFKKCSCDNYNCIYVCKYIQ